ncbi:uncharacterized protein F4812DRAFT_459451 [Daldinia caldariorum]|uniref:uncharacterized protein n=1 Tax=Daldinia caldariorum TaxID=326644 RepID=UPI0020077CE0|nr:uncharacterized protein F4812DRAFT_459451 [Daldinia caldariorum]KAI1467347.1 hypothetical protein F4812DRAFT_459451 [Daldinia caldariorum]
MRFSVVAAGFLAAVASAQSETNAVTSVESSAAGATDVTTATSVVNTADVTTATSVVDSADVTIGTSTAGQSVTTGTQPSVTVSIDPAQSSAQSAILNCLNACDASDVSCQAKCIAVPNPSDQNVNQTTECVAQCPQGKGTEADNKAYADCVSGCIAQYFYTSTNAPGATTSATGTGSHGTTKATPSVTQVESTVTSGGSTFVTSFSTTVAPSETDSSSPNSASAAPSSTSSGAADMLFTPISSGVGLFSFLAAFLAL